MSKEGVLEKYGHHLAACTIRTNIYNEPISVCMLFIEMHPDLFCLFYFYSQEHVNEFIERMEEEEQDGNTLERLRNDLACTFTILPETSEIRPNVLSGETAVLTWSLMKEQISKLQHTNRSSRAALFLVPDV